MDFEPLDYSNVTMDKLDCVASMGLVDLTVQIKQWQKRKTLPDGRVVNTYAVSDPTGT